MLIVVIFQAVKSEVEDHEAEVETLVETAGVLAQASNDPRLATLTTQTHTRYQTLQTTVKVSLIEGGTQTSNWNNSNCFSQALNRKRS